MPEKKFNVGTLILGIVIGAVVVGIIWAASKPAKSGAVVNVVSCFPSGPNGGCFCNIVNDPFGGSSLAINLPNVPADVCAKIGSPSAEIQ